MHDYALVRTRSTAMTAGPLAALSLVLLVASVIRLGDDAVALAADPLALVSSALGLLALVAALVALARLVAVHAALRTGGGLVASGVAVSGTVLAAGGQWSMLFVLPGLADAAPEAAATGMTSVTVGYVASFALLGLGWASVGVRLRGSVSSWASRGLVVGGLLCVTPLPSRWLVIAVVVSLLAAKEKRAHAVVLPRAVAA